MRICFTILLSISLLLFANTGCKRSHSHHTSSSSKHRGKSSSGEKNNKDRSSGSSSSDVKKLIKTARGYTGTPYKYGGTSRAGLDCSGLTSLSFQSINITIPRTSAAQSTIGKAVDLKDIQPGDLVFFSDNKKSKKITHVGLITEVNGDHATFIHASTKLGVVENELLSGYYFPLIVKVRRVF